MSFSNTRNTYLKGRESTFSFPESSAVDLASSAWRVQNPAAVADCSYRPAKMRPTQTALIEAFLRYRSNCSTLL